MGTGAKCGVVALGAPTTLGLRRADPVVPAGVGQAPSALRAAGLLRDLGARDAGDCPPVDDYDPQVDRESGILNAAPVSRYSVRLADHLERLFAGGEFTVVLGGDCSILLGIGLALSRIGRHGLIFLDGHSDFYTPESSRSRQAAAMELWLATGHGPTTLSGLAGESPLFDPCDVVLVGTRDHDERASSDAPDPGSAGIHEIPWTRMNEVGVGTTVEEALNHLGHRGVDRIWLHVDVDVLDSVVMPAVDDHLPGGLSYQALQATLQRVIASGLIAGVDVTIFDPTLDPDGSLAAVLTSTLKEGLIASPRD